jgi:5-methylcytosine-specific restriction endonuclease McrBC GTP-binding regulatory subunit McrB
MNLQYETHNSYRQTFDQDEAVKILRKKWLKPTIYANLRSTTANWNIQLLCKMPQLATRAQDFQGSEPAIVPRIHR